MRVRSNEVGMTDVEYCRKLDELDRLLNDPTVPMQPDRIWSLMDDFAARPAPGFDPPEPRRP